MIRSERIFTVVHRLERKMNKAVPTRAHEKNNVGSNRILSDRCSDVVLIKAKISERKSNVILDKRN